MIIAIFFIIGIIVGSFLNVVVYRFRVAEDMFFGRSKCPHCKNQLSWYDNIPLVSFILLKFSCRHCKKKISWQYPLVEFFTGLLFVLVGMKFFNPTDSATFFATFHYLAIGSFLVVIFVYDMLYLEIPGPVLWLAIGWTVLYNLIVDWMGSGTVNDILRISTYSGTLAAFAAFIFFFGLVAVSREKWMGMGDAYLVVFLGLIVGWPQILLALFLAFTIGSIYGLAAIALRKKNFNSQVPFAPFLILGTIIAIFFYMPIANWYIGLISF